MVFHSHNSGSSHFTINSAYREEWCGEIIRCLWVNAIYFHTARTVNVLSAAQIDSHVCHPAALRAKEHQVALACLLPVICGNLLSCESLL